MNFFRRLFGKKAVRSIPEQLLPGEDEDDVIYLSTDDDLSLAAEFEAAATQAVVCQKIYTETGDVATLDEAIHFWERVLEHPFFPKIPERAQLMAFNDAGAGFMSRYRARGRLDDLKRALSLWRLAVQHLDSPELPMYLSNLGDGLRVQYEQAGDPGDLEEAIRMSKQAVTLTPSDSPDLPNHLNTLSVGLHTLYYRTGNLADLEEAIRMSKRAVALTPPDSPGLPTLLGTLSNLLADSYERTKDQTNLEEALRVAHQAVALAPSSSLHLPATLHILGSRLLDQYKLTKNLTDLEEALRVLRQAVELTSPDSPDLPSYLGHLGDGLHDRYDRTRALIDLDESIRAFRQAVQYTLPNSLYPYTRRYISMGNALRDRYNQIGNLEDLTEAVHAYQQAVKVTPSDSPDLPKCLNNLAAGLKARYERTGSSEDLNEVIRVFQRAVTLFPPDSPYLSRGLSNLAEGFEARYERTGSLEDLNEVIRVFQQAVTLSPPDSPYLYAPLTGLGAALSRWSILTKNQSDLKEALQVSRQALAVCPPDSPHLSACLSNLSDVLQMHYTSTGDLAELDESIHLSYQAIQHTPPDSPELHSHLTQLGDGLRMQYKRTEKLADLEESIRIYRQAVQCASRDSLAYLVNLISLGNCLEDLYNQTQHQTGLAEAITAYREGCRGGASLSSIRELICGRSWGNWAFERQSWTEAVEAYEYVYQAIERLFEVQIQRSGKESWLRILQSIPARAAYAIAKTGNVDRAVEYLEIGCARLLAERLEQTRRDLQRLSAAGYRDVYDRYRQAAEHITVIQARQEQDGLPSSLFSSSQPVTIGEVHAARDELHTAIDAIRELPGFSDFFKPFGFERIQKVASRIPLVYLASTPAGGIALIVTKEKSEAVWLDLDSDTLDQLLIEGKNHTGGYLLGQLGIKAWLETSLQYGLPLLGGELMGPLAERLSDLDIDSVVLIPVGRLSLLPLHAASYLCLWNGKTVHFLDKFDVSYAPSARALAVADEHLLANSSQSTTMTGVGNPLPHPRPLLYAQTELEEIATFFDTHAHPLYGKAATKAALLEKLPGISHVHLACHGTFDPGKPLNSALQLANQEELTLGEILEYNVFQDNRLVVLSACQTAINDFNNLPDEFVGLPGGLLQAGVPGVVGTLWSVNDLATALVMIKFYEYALHGDSSTGKRAMSLSQALCAAQRWLRDVTAGELLAYFEQHKAIQDAQRQLEQRRMPEEVVVEGVMRFAWEDPRSCPFHDKPYYWAPFVFFGI